MKNGITESLEEARWRALSPFGLDKPSGDLKRDLFENKKVLIQRGLEVSRVEAAPDMGKNIYQFIASTGGVKRDGNIVMNDGWHLDNFKKNPAFIWCHDYHSLPIGRHVKWEVSGTGESSVLRMWSEFCDEGLNPFAVKVRKMYDSGFLKAVSIGWNPIKWEWIQDEEGEVEGLRFIENDLLELSAVSVPADPNAIIEAVHQRILSSGDIARMAEYGMIPRIYRGMAYAISSIDAEVKESTNESDEEPMLGEIMEAVTKLGEEVRSIREDLSSVKTRIEERPMEDIPKSIEPSEPVAVVEADASRAVSVDAEPLQGDETDNNEVPECCDCSNHGDCVAACGDNMKRRMSHFNGIRSRAEGRSIELDDTFVAMVTEVRGKLDEVLSLLPEVRAVEVVIDEPVTEVDTEFETRMAGLSEELGLTEKEVTVDDILARAVAFGVVRTVEPKAIEKVEATVEDLSSKDELDGGAGLIEEMLKNLRKI